MKVLYISYDGMTDPLGQSQVIPYLAGLSAKGHKIHVLSCEKPKAFAEGKTSIQELLRQHGIQWTTVLYTKKPPVLSTLWDLFKLKLRAYALHRKYGFEAVHCRSYLASLIGCKMKARFKTKFIFDMRGFWADERVDGALWNLRHPLYRAVYEFFKKKEKRFLVAADQVICLTHLAKQEIESWKVEGAEKMQLEIIPCCSDLDHFSRERVEFRRKYVLKTQVGLRDEDFVVTYLGSIGTWYMLDEMLMFFKRLLLKYPTAKFLFITPDAPEVILSKAKELEIDLSRIAITKATRRDVPNWLSLAHVGLFFIKPVYSKRGSSPTKLGELLSMGLPVISNSGVGDSEWIAERFKIGPVVTKFDDLEYDRAVEALSESLMLAHQDIRAAAESYFSLKQGIEQYQRIYSRLEAL